MVSSDASYKALIDMINEMDLEVMGVTAAAKRFTADLGYDPSYGARPLKRAVQKYIEDPVSEHIISSRMLGSIEGMSERGTIRVSLSKDKNDTIVEWV